MKLNWQTSIPASWAHAAASLAAELPLNDKTLADTLHPVVGDMCVVLGAGMIEPAQFFDHLVPLAHDYENAQGLAEVALRKCKGREAAEALASRMGEEIIDLRKRFQQYETQVASELPVRLPVMREQWEARGPGMLHAIAALSESGLLSEQATVYLVSPACGGGGRAHPWYNAVHLEAVLANPHPQLPEVVRLGWLLAQMNLDLPKYHDDLGIPMYVAQIAMMPLALAAAQEVGWAQADDATIRLAAQTWMPESMWHADTLVDWWHIYERGRPGWATGVTSLAMLMAQS